MIKHCNLCGKDKKISAFHKGNGSLGRTSNCKQCKKKWVQSNKNHLKVYQKQYHLKNKEKHNKQSHDGYWRNRIPYIPKTEKEKKGYKRKWYELNKKDCIARARVSKAKRREQIYKNGGSFTKDEWLDLCERFNEQCVCCGNRAELTVDHIIPISQDGKNSIDNIQPLCLSCNLKKGIKKTNYIDIILVNN